MESTPPSKLSTAALLLYILLCGVACTRGTRLHHYQAVPRTGWSRADTLVFPLPASPADTSYRGTLGMRVSPAFPYRTLWLALRYDLSHPDTSYTDTLCCAFCDSTGRLTGLGITRLQYQHPLPPFRLRAGQGGNLRIHHLMKKESIPEVYEVGIRM